MTHPLLLTVSLLLCVSLAACQNGNDRQASASASSGPMRVYVGTYTNAKSKGIYVMELDPKTGSLTEPKLAAETKSPSFLALHPNRKFLFAVGEIDNFQGKKTGSVAAFSVNDDGMLTPINQQPSSGTGPCHLEVEPGGTAVLVANYGSGSVALLPVNSDGSLKPPSSAVQHQGSSVNKQRQEGPHAHCINVAPAAGNKKANRALVADLGLDKVLVYQFDASKGLVANDPPAASTAPGAGPRHVAFGRGGKHVYVNGEMTSTVIAFTYDAKSGAMKEIQTLSTLPDGFDKSKNSTAEIAVHPSGKFVYVSNRGHDSIAIFKVDQKTGKLTAAGHQSTQGKTPRNFGIDPTGRFLLAANQGSDTVVVFAIDQQTGALSPTGTVANVPTPVCVTFLPTGR